MTGPSTSTGRLPVVSAAAFAAPGAAGSAAELLDRACGDIGFFLLEDHGIDPAVRRAAFDASAALFAMPESDKERLAIGRSSCHRGYVGFRAEAVDPAAGLDRKEAFDLSVHLDADHPEVAAGTPLYGPNQWPPLAGFRAAVEAYYDAGMAAARLVCTGLALALGLDRGFFTDRLRDSVSNLRLLHYPPAEHDRPGTCGDHADYGMITLLAEDGTGGLEVRRRDGEWLAVHAEPHQLVVNLGDLLARWSNDRWVSTRHRVVNRAPRDRYSIPLFVNPGFHEVVEPIVAGGEPPAHPPITAGEYLLSRFDLTHRYRQAAPA